MKGVDELIKKINKLKATEKELKEELELTAVNIRLDASRAAPQFLSGQIVERATNGGLTQEIVVNGGNIGAYIEFGTGAHAAELLAGYPEDWVEIAKRFYINGQGTLPAAPYLYPAYVKHATKLPERIKLILDNAVK